jgi:hypothetical protein
MQQQNYSNHRRYVPAFHFLTSSLILLVFILAVVQLIQGLINHGEWLSSGLIPLIISIVLLLLFWYSRRFAVTVQNRAIRTEENLRHYILTGKQLDSRLTMGQIIALRFAPDEEYLQIIKQAVDEKMKPDDIKKAIKNWKADHYRA